MVLLAWKMYCSHSGNDARYNRSDTVRLIKYTPSSFFCFSCTAAWYKAYRLEGTPIWKQEKTSTVKEKHPKANHKRTVTCNSYCCTIGHQILKRLTTVRYYLRLSKGLEMDTTWSWPSMCWAFQINRSQWKALQVYVCVCVCERTF